MRYLPAQEPPTGALSLGLHPGVYLRNDYAITVAKDLESSLVYLKQNAPQTLRVKIEELMNLLRSVR